MPTNPISVPPRIKLTKDEATDFVKLLANLAVYTTELCYSKLDNTRARKVV